MEYPNGDRVGTPVKRRLSPTLFFYVTREFAVPLACCLLAFTALFLLNNIFDDLPDFLKARGRGEGALSDLVTYLLILQPLNMVHVLPMSILLAASFMTAMLCRHHEMTALRAAGISLFVSGLPVWILSFLLSGATLWISEDLAPECAAQAELMREGWTASPKEKRREARLAYHNAGEKRDWFFEEFVLKKAYRGILVKQFRPDDTTEWELQAAYAEYRDGKWIFYDGARSFFDSDGKLPVGTEMPFETLSPEQVSETPRQILNHLRPVEELSIAGILRMFRFNRTIPERTRQVFLTTIWYRVCFPFSCFIGALLGVGLTSTTERSSSLRGFAEAVGIMMLYYMISQLTLVFGRNGYLPPAIAGGGPTVLFVGLGLTILYRKR
jgi:lipopolysaccharide export system permease protein